VNFAFYAFAFFVVANPLRWRLSVPERNGLVRPRPLVFGVALLVLAATAIATGAGSVLESLDISPESWRIAAGIVIIGGGLWVMAFPQRRREPELRGWWAGLVPTFFPVLLTPELFVLLESTGADEGVAVTLWALVLPVAALLAMATGRRTATSETVMTGMSRLLGALAVAVGIALIISGIRDV
jgi:small neutral amino acid transporter SnatA (MarC family)